MHILLLTAWLALAAPARAGMPARTVDLDAPQALEQLARDNPGHYRMVRRILDEAPRQSPAALQGWLRVTFDAKAAPSGYMLRTSHPPRARLSFQLDDTRYQGMIVLRNVEPAVLR